MTEAAELDVRLDHPLPSELAVGPGTALFVLGSCFHPAGPIRSLTLVGPGTEEPVMAHGMPRLDLFRTLHPRLDPFATTGMGSDPDSPEDPRFTSYRSGFWGLLPIPAAPAGGVVEVSLRAELEDGRTVTGELARIPVAETVAPVPAPAPGEGPLVAISMATFDPPPDLLRRQLQSIRDQTHGNWVCVISDDCSRPERLAALEAEIEGDPRFVLSRSPRRLGFYRNFERALALAPAEADYVAMADQDDAWHPDKIATLLEALGDARLVYSDARIITPAGELVADTYWGARRNNHTSLASLLMANSVTGAASLFGRDLLEAALPFPPGQFAHFHDHWVALTALAQGDIAFVDRPLYDYVQHDTAVLGHAAANRTTALRDRLGRLGDDPRERVGRWRMHFFVDNCRLLQDATVLRMRCGPAMSRAKRRELDSFVRADRSWPALARLALRAVPELAGRRPETLGAEVGLSLAFLWRRILQATTRGLQRPPRRFRFDSVPPPNLAPRPGRRGPEGGGPRTVAEKIAPLELVVSEDAPERINLLIPTIDLDHLFGGYIAKFNLARRLAESGARVRIVTVDPVGPLPRAWRERLEAYAGLEGLSERVEVAFGREAQGLEVSRADRFVATTWWSAHIAHAATRALDGPPFLYLVQEYEPFTFAMGTWAALAQESYRFPHRALFSTELLRDYFRRQGIGVYAAGTEAGDRDSVSFQNAITAVDPPAAADLAGRAARRLLFYARPEDHAARNMFELGVLALDRALELGAFAGWELHGIGTLESGRRVSLGGGAALDLLPRSAQSDYADVLRAHDVGLALMFTPHPSLVPIEMASAGMLTVTNSFENKTPEALAAISPNLVGAEPGIESIAAALVAAADGVEDFDRRAAGARVDWSRDWATSFDDALVRRLLEFLG